MARNRVVKVNSAVESMAAKAREDELCAQLQRLVRKFRECVDCETPGNLVRLTLEVARAEELLRIR
jgi:hypothetical protein